MQPTGYKYNASIICPDCAEVLYFPFEDDGIRFESVEDMFCVFSFDETDTETYCGACGEFIETTPLSIATEIHTWFERDRAHVELRAVRTERTIIEWWDEEVQEAIEDGFLNPKDYHKSALEYAKERGLLYA